MEMFFIIFFILTAMFFYSDKSGIGATRVFKSLWYSVATIGCFAIIICSISYGAIKYQEIEGNKRKVAYQEMLREKWSECSERAKVIQDINQISYETALILSNCTRPSEY